MPNPTFSDIHVNKPLTNISVAWIQEESAFISDKVFPSVPVQKQSDRYFVYFREDWYRDEARKRVYGNESAGGGYRIDNTPSYYCDIWAYHKDVTAQDRANSDNPLSPDEDATIFLTQKLLLKREIEWATRFFASGIWGTEYTGGATTSGTTRKYWSSSSSDPIGDISDMQIAIQAATGYKPNVLALGPYVYKELRNHSDILDRIKYTQKGVVTADLLATLFDVEKVVVASAVKNSAAQGGTESTDFIMGKHALLAYVPPRPALRTPSAGYIMSWIGEGFAGAGMFGNRIAKIPMDWLGLGTTRIEGEMAFACELVSSDLGGFFNSIVE